MLGVRVYVVDEQGDCQQFEVGVYSTTYLSHGEKHQIQGTNSAPELECERSQLDKSEDVQKLVE